MALHQTKPYNTSVSEIGFKELILRIQEWVKFLLGKWLIIVIVGLTGAALGLIYAYLKKPTYVATTTFVLEDEKRSGGLGSLAGLASIAGVDLGGNGGGIFQGDNILGLYKSRNMLAQTLLSEVKYNESSKLLVDLYIEFNELNKKWKDKPELINLKFTPGKFVDGEFVVEPHRLRDSVIGVIIQDLNKNYLNVLKPDKKLSIIQVDVISKNEVFAKSFNDALVKNVNEFYVRTKTKKTLQNVNILQNKTDSVRAVMNNAIFTAASVADATPNLNPIRQVQRVGPSQKAQFSAETNKAILEEIVKNLEMTKLSLLRETPLIQEIDKPIYPLKIVKPSKIKGIIIGGILAGLLVVVFLILKRLYKNAILDEAY